MVEMRCAALTIKPAAARIIVCTYIRQMTEAMLHQEIERMKRLLRLCMSCDRSGVCYASPLQGSATNNALNYRPCYMARGAQLDAGTVLHGDTLQLPLRFTCRFASFCSSVKQLANSGTHYNNPTHCTDQHLPVPLQNLCTTFRITVLLFEARWRHRTLSHAAFRLPYKSSHCTEDLLRRLCLCTKARAERAGLAAGFVSFSGCISTPPHKPFSVVAHTIEAHG